MREHLKPYKFAPERGSLKTPMPAPKKVKKLENLKEKGLDVNYPRAPWFTDNVEKLKQEEKEREERIQN